MSGEAHQDDEDEQEDLDPDIEVADLLVKSAAYGRGGFPRRGGYGGRGGRSINLPSYSDVVRGSHPEGEGQSSDIPVEKPQSPGSLANRSRFGQLNLVEEESTSIQGGRVHSESNEDWTQVGKDKDCLATAGSWLYGLVVFSRYLTGIKTLGPLNFWYSAGDGNLEL
ncbi:hypothetical protein U1Q18_017930 [Sarracenia purpurea var. burkii]